MRRRALLTALVAVAFAAQAQAAGTPPTRYDLPAGELRLSDSRLNAGARAKLTMTVRLDRSVRKGRLVLTLPRRWTQRSSVSGVAYARLPRSGRASGKRVKVTRSGRVVSFAFTRGRRGDDGRYVIGDNGIAAGSYRLPFSWRVPRRARVRGSARVIFEARPRGSS